MAPMNEKGNQYVRSAVEFRHRVLKAIREFFYARDYIEVETPYLTWSAPSDPYIEPLKVHVGERGPYYLHTSPEIGMKKVLASGTNRIFQICKVFRVEEFEEHHSVEFTMVEWYRPGTYRETMAETMDLIRSVGRATGTTGDVLEYLRRPWGTYRIGELFLELVGFDPLPLSLEDLRSAIKRQGLGGMGPGEGWADLFFRLLVQEIEPRLVNREGSPYFVIDWPAILTAMAARRDDHTAERFELYMKGLEIANGYTELLEPEEQRRRIAADNEQRRIQDKHGYDPDEEFLQALGRISGPVSGVSVGIDRLMMVLLEKESISGVLPDRFSMRVVEI
jgi:lysyl-tRNA synthetase class 2